MLRYRQEEYAEEPDSQLQDPTNIANKITDAINLSFVLHFIFAVKHFHLKDEIWSKWSSNI